MSLHIVYSISPNNLLQISSFYTGLFIGTMFQVFNSEICMVLNYSYLERLMSYSTQLVSYRP